MATARDELFDVAVNKAADYAVRVGLPLDDAHKLRAGLEVWYLKTRFAYRAPFEEVLAVLAVRPVGSSSVWQGGPRGEWTTPTS